MLIAARPPEVEEEEERQTIRDGLAYGRALPIDLNTLPDSAQFRGYRQHSGNGGAAPEPAAQEQASPNPESDQPSPEWHRDTGAKGEAASAENADRRSI